jgi:isopentenyl phosphate kinase
VGRTIIKFGGALITEKESRKVFRPDTISAIAPILSNMVNSGMDLIIVHGAGSFGHIDAKSGDLSRGRVSGREEEQHRAKETVRKSMNELNSSVVSILESHGIRCRCHPPREWANGTGPKFKGDIRRFEEHGYVHVTFGDVVDVAGDREFGILSGDHLMERLSTELPEVEKVIFLLDGIDGLYDKDPINKDSQMIPVWTSSTSYETSINELTDVTGGMALKVEVASRISKNVPLVTFVNGLDPANLHDLLIGERFIGTLFERAKSDE